MEVILYQVLLEHIVTLSLDVAVGHGEILCYEDQASHEEQVNPEKQVKHDEIMSYEDTTHCHETSHEKSHNCQDDKIDQNWSHAQCKRQSEYKTTIY